MPPSIDHMLHTLASAPLPMPRATNRKNARLPGDIAQPARIAGRSSRLSR